MASRGDHHKDQDLLRCVCAPVLRQGGVQYSSSLITGHNTNNATPPTVHTDKQSLKLDFRYCATVELTLVKLMAILKVCSSQHRNKTYPSCAVRQTTTELSTVIRLNIKRQEQTHISFVLCHVQSYRIHFLVIHLPLPTLASEHVP